MTWTDVQNMGKIMKSKKKASYKEVSMYEVYYSLSLEYNVVRKHTSGQWVFSFPKSY